MAADHPYEEQRRSFRCPVTAGQQTAELRAGRRRIPVVLVDESSGGYAVLAAELPETDVPTKPPAPAADAESAAAIEPAATQQKRIELHTATAAFEVEIRNCHEVDPPDDWPPSAWGDSAADDRPSSATGHGAAPGTERDATGASSVGVKARPACYRLGLQRVAEIDPFELAAEQARSSRHSALRSLAKMFPGGQSVAVAGLLIAVIGLAGVLLLVFGSRMAMVRWADDDVPTAAQVRFGGGGSRTRGSRSSSAAARQVERAADGAAREVGRVGRAADRATREEITRLRQLVAASPGATVFTLPQVAEQLALSSAQRADIARLESVTEEAIRQLDGPELDLSRAEKSRRRQQIHSAARRKALGLLDAEQRRRWSDLSDE